MTTELATASKCCKQAIDDDDDGTLARFLGEQQDEGLQPVASERGINNNKTTIDTHTTNNKSSSTSPDNYSTSEQVKDKFCDIRLAADNNTTTTSPSSKTAAAAAATTKSIDSRSILINKERLKKFWESRMEMEFKLRQERADSGRLPPSVSIKQQQQQAGAKLADENNNNNNSNGGDHDEQQQQVVNLSDEEWRSLSPTPSGELKTKVEEVPNQVSLCNKNTKRQKQAEQQQLMSIDPTLCHPRSSPGDSRSALLEEEHDEFRSEEQTINEEFSSTSSCSFGPMSISVVQQQPEAEVDEEGGEEEQNDSTLSGSVQTVITTQVELPKQQSNEEEEEQQQQHDDEEEDDETGSNIGVAFESLHFDNEIKSSKQEQVDEHLLLIGSPLSPAPATATVATKSDEAPATNRFSAKEVKSVCNYITAAISDASRQVEGFIHGTNDDDKPAERNIERATFVEATSQHVDSDQFPSELEQTKAADLSSIFEANVRREIQRFEQHSSDSRQSSNGSSSISSSRLSGSSATLCPKTNGSMTEWRIAEEIRLFNEREMELKSRLVATGANGNSSRGSRKQSIGECGESQVVRFGKTLRIPKVVAPAAAPPTNVADSQAQVDTVESHQDQSAARVGGGIKLSSSLTPGAAQQSQQQQRQQCQPAISMHKFIASGGKRFVLTSSPQHQQQQQHHHHHHHHHHHLSKSMSSLSMGSAPASAGAASATSKPVADYKAADSLRCKETPNVEPGMARKVIESFSRLRSSQSNCCTPELGSGCRPQLSAASSSVQLAQADYSSVRRQPIKRQTSGSPTPTPATANSTNGSSAERKIQEELREMRAREAELRNQQKQRQLQMQQAAAATADTYRAQLEKAPPTTRTQPATNIDEEQVHLHNRTTARQQHQQVNSSSESLYPIKQAIDSFRRLNNLPTTTQINGTAVVQKSDADNYDSKVGGQRRKIALIERWECNNVC